MKNIHKKLGLFIAVALMVSSCSVYDDRDDCQPDTGSVSVNVFVESFASSADIRAIQANSETAFNSSIESLFYYLYYEDMIIEQGEISDVDAIETPMWVFQRDNLAPGNYKLGLFANSSEDILVGNPNVPSQFMIQYQDDDNNGDYFIDLYEFYIAEGSAEVYETQLKRMQGMVRFTFRNVSPEIRAIGVSMNGLTSRVNILGNYSTDYVYKKIIPVNSHLTRVDSEEPTTIGTFPSMNGESTSWYVTLYSDYGTKVYSSERLASDKLTITRNRLLDLDAQFDGDQLTVTVKMDTEWDGSEQGGEVGLD